MIRTRLRHEESSKPVDEQLGDAEARAKINASRFDAIAKLFGMSATMEERPINAPTVRD